MPPYVGGGIAKREFVPASFSSLRPVLRVGEEEVWYLAGGLKPDALKRPYNCMRISSESHLSLSRPKAYLIFCRGVHSGELQCKYSKSERYHQNIVGGREGPKGSVAGG